MRNLLRNTWKREKLSIVTKGRECQPISRIMLTSNFLLIFSLMEEEIDKMNPDKDLEDLSMSGSIDGSDFEDDEANFD